MTRGRVAVTGRAAPSADFRATAEDQSHQGRTVLVAHPHTDLYGSGRVTLSTAEALVARGYRVVVTVPGQGPLVPAIEATGADLVICKSPVLRKTAMRPIGLLRLFTTTVASLIPGLRLLRSRQPDLVYVSTVAAPLWLALARLTRRASICHVHEAEPRLSMLVQRALAAPVLLSSSVVANSEFSREALASAMPRLRARSVTVPNPVPGPPSVTPARQEMTGAVRLLYVGRLSRRKGAHIAVAAVEELRSRGVDAHLQLLGSVFSGYEWFEQELRLDVANKRLDDRVTFLGFRADIWPVVAEADVVVVPSVAAEPFGNTAVEAALSARPVIVSAAGGLCEAVAGYASAQVVPPEDPAAIADAVEKVVADWPHYRAAASTDAVVAADRHAQAAYADRLERIALDVLSDSRKAGGDGR